MKKVIISILLGLLVAKLKAQNFTKYADTANYLIHEIENKKALFIDKPMSVLLDSLKISPLISYTAVFPKTNFGKKLYLEFNSERIFERAHFIIVEFDSVPPYSLSFSLFFPSTGGKGAIGDILAVYRSLKVKDISVKNYNGDDPVNPDVHY